MKDNNIYCGNMKKKESTNLLNSMHKLLAMVILPTQQRGTHARKHQRNDNQNTKVYVVR